MNKLSKVLIVAIVLSLLMLVGGCGRYHHWHSHDSNCGHHHYKDNHDHKREEKL